MDVIKGGGTTADQISCKICAPLLESDTTCNSIDAVTCPPTCQETCYTWRNLTCITGFCMTC